MAVLKPTKRQLEFQEWEFGVFIHFGIRTYYEGHKDFDAKSMPSSIFNPVNLDCKSWVKSAKEAGANYMVLTAKHHDGFANWPTIYSNYSVANTMWSQGKGDVVKEFITACREYDMKIGLYYSPMEVDMNCINMDYDDYFILQISELLMNYGNIDILWFDGCGSEGHQYNWQRIISEIRRMQPDILIFNMGDPDFRWTGNEAGLVTSPNWNTCNRITFSINAKESPCEDLKESWLPVECDCRMRELNWFYSDTDEDTVKSLEELMAIYYYSVGRGANLLINIGPNRQGLLPILDSKRLLEFGDEIKRRFSNPLVSLSSFDETNDTWVYESSQPIQCNHVILQENLEEGERIKSFSIHIIPYPEGRKVTIYKGENIGHKTICSFPLVKASEIIIDITESNGKPMLRDIQLFRITHSKEEGGANE